MALAPDGNFYGTTLYGGISSNGGYGTVYRITANGTFTLLYSFCSLSACSDGEYPRAAPVPGPDGNLYGTASLGGAQNDFAPCGPVGCGTVFKISPQGVLTTIYDFCSDAECSDGFDPTSALLLAPDGNFYGTSDDGGNADACPEYYGCGTAFKVTLSGKLTTLHRFDGEDGALPFAGLAQDTNGRFYGITGYGGSSDACPGGCGTLFEVATGLRPFVETMPEFAKVGKPINILGSDLTGATNVTFNGTPATFTVVSPSLITTSVPTGATTGPVQVVTPGGTLTSNVPFQVVQ